MELLVYKADALGKAYEQYIPINQKFELNNSLKGILKV